MKKRLAAALLVLVMAVSVVSPALAVETGNTAAASTTVLQRDDAAGLVTNPNGVTVPGEGKGSDVLTWQDAAGFLLRCAGLEESQLGAYPDDYNAMAKSIGLVGDSFQPDKPCTPEMFQAMQNNPGLKALKKALSADKLQPLFINGEAQPIFPYTTGSVEEGYSNEDSDAIRYMVYVETNYDTDDDGKLDLVQTLVQVPKAAVEGDYKAAAIYEARPYITGCTPFWGETDGYGTAGYDLNKLYSTPAARKAAGSATTMQAAANADSKDWYYWNEYEDMFDYEDLTWYDYYLVRGFAVVECGGLGTKGSDGFETCGADLEIGAFKCVIEWLHGDRVAYTDKTSNIEIKADWSNGNVGMTGRSYAGTTQFGLAATGVEGLKTIVPVAGIASWYEYTNSQGISTERNPAYSDVLALYCAGRYLDPADWSTISKKYGEYLYQIQQDQLATNGDYSDHWANRDYTLTADKIQCPALIVHGLNDDNVRTKEFDLMYKAYQKAGVDAKILLHQDAHLTPTYPSQEIQFSIGDDSYDAILNRWFSHYLYGVDNGVENMPAVTAQDSHDPDAWNTYSSWDNESSTTLTSNAADKTTTITSDYASNNVSRDNWRDAFTAGSTPNSAMYTMPVDKDTTIKGSVAVNFRAATANVETPAVPEAPRGDAKAVVDHDNFVDPTDHDNFVNPSRNAPASVTASIPDADLIDRDGLMVSAMLVDIAPEGKTFPAFNTKGSYVPKTTLKEDGAWMGGGLGNFDLVSLNTADVSYKIVARGWMDLCNPGTGYDSASAAAKVKLEEGKYYDYTLYLQPNLYEVEAGHTLALVVYAYEPGMASYTQNYSITLDNASVKADIPVSAAPVVLPSFPFTDVPADHWACAGIEYAYVNGLFKGTSDTTFGPNRNMTREQMWMVLARMNGTAPADMDAARDWAMENGISDGTNPKNPVTREQFVTLLWRSAKTPASSYDLSAYTDLSTVSDYAKTAMAWAVEKGVVNGTSETKLSPKNSATRAQIAVILARYCQM